MGATTSDFDPADPVLEFERPDVPTLRFYVKVVVDRHKDSDVPVDPDAVARQAVADLIGDGLMPTFDDVASTLTFADAAAVRINQPG